ncbi:hypothetical protein DAPPUDRAFT_111452 [Daphnia pulex]|uniref:Ionotropic glutamate receptor C-terminal domain-containing protein n=1 Tax=Daphnia pulex TaxID=6669 RepID=E9H978_DAPPU|nr:hypothetical protein DAPPUDRAFT_111452 [Daphnia pulex]|eukprot:EFX71751.1 hypothetical protein DAPPUDRAFT_111452 [Daphnia pulex]
MTNNGKYVVMSKSMFANKVVKQIRTASAGLTKLRPHQDHLSSFLLNSDNLNLKEADLFVGAVVGTLNRFKDSDFSAPWMAGPLSILIPIPESSVNIGALVEPMSTEVWICIAVSVLAVIASLIGLSKCINALNERTEPKKTEKNSGGSSFYIIDYVISVLLSQGANLLRHINIKNNTANLTRKKLSGAYCEKRQLAIRIAAAAWSLACFVLVQAYSSTLIAFITSPNTKPIINSVNDIPNVPGLKITVSRNLGADLKLQQTDYGIYKKLGDSLREDPSLRCIETEICLDKVRSGNFVYIHHFKDAGNWFIGKVDGHIQP